MRDTPVLSEMPCLSNFSFSTEKTSTPVLWHLLEAMLFRFNNLRAVHSSHFCCRILTYVLACFCTCTCGTLRPNEMNVPAKSKCTITALHSLLSLDCQVCPANGLLPRLRPRPFFLSSYGAFSATTPRSTMLTPFDSEGTALMCSSTPLAGARTSRVTLPK